MIFETINGMTKKRGPRIKGDTPLARFLNERNITLNEIADILSLTPQQVSNLASGKSAISHEYMVRLTDHYGLPWDYFYEKPQEKAAYQIGPQITQLRKMYGITIDEFSERTNIKLEHAIELEENRRLADDSVVERIHSAFGVHHAWITQGTGDPFYRPPRDYRMVRTPGLAEYRTHQGTTIEQRVGALSDEMIRIIAMAIDVLISNTHYADSLVKNIQSLYRGVITERESLERERRLEHRVAELERRLAQIAPPGDEPAVFPPAGASRTTRPQAAPEGMGSKSSTKS